MKQNKWYNYNQCNPARNNQKSEARQAIDDVAKAKKRLIKHQMRQQKKKSQSEGRPAVTEAKAHINEAITNSDVDEAKQMVRLQSMQSNQMCLKNQKQDKQLIMKLLIRRQRSTIMLMQL